MERVEKIKRAEIEIIGSRRVLQYRGGSLPLVCVDDVASVSPLAEQENLLVIVFRLKGRDVGLLASGPVDAIEVSTDIDATTLRQTGIMGSAIIGSTTTMLVDIFELVQTIHPEWFTGDAETGEEEQPTVLIVDDSVFFRNQVRSYLEQAGFRILEASTASTPSGCWRPRISGHQHGGHRHRDAQHGRFRADPPDQGIAPLTATCRSSP